ncbi:EspA/EspE family type VII secretion system effector [Mycobacterium sp. NPDC003323]
MGVFDFMDNIVDGVSEVAEKAKKAAEWVVEIADNLGLPKLSEIAKTTADGAGKLIIAPTFILQEGQKHIDRMLKSCGEGNPDHANQFTHSAEAFKSAQAPLKGAYPSDQWSGGTAADRYSEKNKDQENKVATLAGLDRELHRLISAEADLLPPIRKSLEIHHNDLADFGNLTQYIGRLGSYGKAAQFMMETAMVATTLAMAIPEYEGMQDEADAIARSVAKVGDEYKRIADDVTISDSANDYDPVTPPTGS